MDSYILFLDETTPNPRFPFFCLAGCCIKETIYTEQLIPEVEQLKNDVFSNKYIVLHEYDIRNCQNPFEFLRSKEKRDLFWDSLTRVFHSADMKVFGTAIHIDNYKKLYSGHNVSDIYFVALQIILENYVHYLEKVNGIGSIILESRNQKENLKLQNHYHNLVANGTLFLTRNAMQEHLSTISFSLKSDNSIGLQLADFIPNSVTRNCFGYKQKTPSLISELNNKFYDGFVGLPDRFGIKCIP